MKRVPVLCVICLVALPQIVSAETPTQFLTFNDNNGVSDAGTYNSNDSFSLDIFLTFSGYNSIGCSVWLETTADAAPHISLTGLTYGTTFNDGNGHHFPAAFTLLQSNGLYTNPNPNDIGATIHGGENVVPPGTYFLDSLSVSLTGLAPGTYSLRSDALAPHMSEATSFDGTNYFEYALPNTSYTITIVPEPSIFALLILTAITFGATTWRRATRLAPRLFAKRSEAMV